MYWDQERDKWRAQVTLEGHKHRLGRFDTPEEAEATVRAFRQRHMPFSEMDRAQQ